MSVAGDAGSVPHPINVRKIEGVRKVVDTHFEFNDWTITVLKGPILPSNCYCDDLDACNSKGICLATGQEFSADAPKTGCFKCHVCRFAEQIQLKHYPEMVFPDNILWLQHKDSKFVLEFSSLEAMRLMSTSDTESIRVVMADAWKASKKEIGLPKEHDFNWTFATEYQGTIKDDATSSNESSKIERNVSESLNIAKLMEKEQILFYEDIPLFEDELHDNGISHLSVKIRVMPSGYFILLRHFLRVDHVMSRISDTRIHFEKENTYFLRQFQLREQLVQNMSDLEPSVFSDPNILYHHLPIVREVTDKVFVI